ncbi:hypothetical protein OSB04_013303 [Centaurea solstitialis]|uniref:NB-ARC domain-containing protein n=1 Tax=Centaurea solstitialis TaxID=347529 RepID=A0AA38TD07_9ASTR|nr:hypothetical protein OSB04_013303 [Centaurea solstitialis]
MPKQSEQRENDILGFRKETEFIEETVIDIRRRLSVPLRVTLPRLIGMDHHIQFITSWLKDESSPTADILTISGMGGIGKTSLARYVFDLHRGEFQRSSFLDDISRRCVGSFNGLLDLENQICSEISKTSSIQVHDVSIYTSEIENALARTKVFLVLDGVDNLNHLGTFLGKKGFHRGSKIIITTKDASLTDRYILHLEDKPKHEKYMLNGLYETESLKLLRLHAFGCNSPKDDYKEASRKLVKYCDGHPLALEVLGASLCNKDVAEWEDYIERLIKKGPHSDIKNVLQMSLDSLDEDDKDLFKHIACFFVRSDRESTETILKACGIHAIFGIQNLIDRCLLQIGWDKKLMMHQLLQEMGRDVVRQESIDKPWKRSRLWCNEESFKVLKQKKGSGKLKGLALDMRMLEKDELFELKTDALSKMHNLMLLQLNYVQLTGSYKNFPEELRWLCMHGFPLKSMPSDLPMENLVALDLSYSNLESFGMSYSNRQPPRKKQKISGPSSKDKQLLLRSLKILNLSFCKQLRSLDCFSELPALERLILANCIGLIEVCESIELCDKLVLIDLSYCCMLKKFPRTMAKLNKVTAFILDGCNLGGSTPNEMIDPEMLKTNNIDTNSNTSSSDVVEVIPRAITSSLNYLPRSLVTLSLSHCKLSTESFPMDFSFLSKLKELDLSGNPIVSLPTCVRSLPMLEKLSMYSCNILKTVEYPPRTLRQLNIKEDAMDEKDCLEKIVFDQEMSPLSLGLSIPFSTPSPFEIKGLVKVEAMADIAEEVLRSLGWPSLFMKNQKVGARYLEKRGEVKMDYEFGIFSTRYDGIEIPNWISHKCSGSSILITIPSSPNNLRGLNFCCVLRDPRGYFLLWIDIKVNNITKNRTWIYRGHRVFDTPARKGLIYLSHWMFGKNEMEDGDQITISVLVPKTDSLGRSTHDISIKECGVKLVFGHGNRVEEEDPLDYYKSWNHIIGGDLSTFLTTSGEYFLYILHFFRGWGFRGRELYIDHRPMFRALPQWKSNVAAGASEFSVSGDNGIKRLDSWIWQHRDLLGDLRVVALMDSGFGTI